MKPTRRHTGLAALFILVGGCMLSGVTYAFEDADVVTMTSSVDRARSIADLPSLIVHAADDDADAMPGGYCVLYLSKMASPQSGIWFDFPTSHLRTINWDAAPVQDFLACKGAGHGLVAPDAVGTVEEWMRLGDTSPD